MQTIKEYPVLMIAIIPLAVLLLAFIGGVLKELFKSKNNNFGQK